MRFFEILTENFESIPRMWLGPRGEEFNLDRDWISHFDFVLKNQEMMGLTDIVGENLTSRGINALAEQQGWVRISADVSKRGGSGTHIAISASSIRNVQKAIRWLHQNQYYPDYVEVEIDSPRGETVDFIVLSDYDAIDTFYKYGKMQRAA